MACSYSVRFTAILGMQTQQSLMEAGDGQRFRKKRKARPLRPRFSFEMILAYFALGASFFQVRFGALVTKPFLRARVETRI